MTQKILLAFSFLFLMSDVCYIDNAFSHGFDTNEDGYCQSGRAVVVINGLQGKAIGASELFDHCCKQHPNTYGFSHYCRDAVDREIAFDASENSGNQEDPQLPTMDVERTY